MLEEAGVANPPITAEDVVGHAEVVEQHQAHRQRRRRGEQRRPAAGPEQSVSAQRRREDDIRRAVAGDEPAQQPRRKRPRRGARPGEEQQGADHQQLSHPVLPQSLAADHPGGGAEGIRHGEQQCDRRRHPAPQQQVEERRGKRCHERGGELLHDPRHVVQPRIRPTLQAQVTDRGEIERRDEHRQHHGIHRDGVAAGHRHHPERRIASPLSGERRDRIEKDGMVKPDRERQVARRVAVAGADRPQVGVVDQQAEEPDEQARPQIAPAPETLGLPRLLAGHRAWNLATAADPGLGLSGGCRPPAAEVRGHDVALTCAASHGILAPLQG